MLTSSDRDLLALKAALVIKLRELDALAPKVELLGNELAALAVEAAELPDQIDPESARRWVRRLAALAPILTTLERTTGQVVHTAAASINAHKVRAETAAKQSETQWITMALRLIQVARRIVHGLAENDHRDAYELALAREIYGPLRLEPPLTATSAQRTFNDGWKHVQKRHHHQPDQRGHQ